MDDKRIVYSLNVSDLQCVARNEFDRDLSDEEIERLKSCLPDTIPWYDCVLTAIDDHIKN